MVVGKAEHLPHRAAHRRAVPRHQRPEVSHDNSGQFTATDDADPLRTTSADRTVLVRRRQHDRGPGRDVGRSAHPGEQILEVGRRRDPDLEDVGLLARDRPARLDLGDAPSRSG